MKALVASDGVSLESKTAKRFEKAAWFLVVDLDDLRLQTFQNIRPTDHYDIVVKASDLGVTTLVTASIGPRSYLLVSECEMDVALANHMVVRQALEKLREGKLEVIDSPTLKRNVEAHEFFVRLEREQYSHGSKPGKMNTVFAAGISRGRHHLQQYGGRGHRIRTHAGNDRRARLRPSCVWE